MKVGTKNVKPTARQDEGSVTSLQQQISTTFAPSLQMKLQWAAEANTVFWGGAESRVTAHLC